MMHLLARLTQLFHDARDWTAAMPEALALIGQQLQLGRVYLFQVREVNGRGLGQTCRFDWAAPGLASLSNDPRNIDEDLSGADDSLQNWSERRRRGEMIEGLTRDLTGYLRADYEYQQILSFLSMPIMINGRWWGHIGFDDCTNERRWSEEERALIRTTALLIGGAVSRSAGSLFASEMARMRMLESALDAVVTADETGRIVEFNPAAEQMFGYRRIDILGRPLTETIIPPHHSQGHQDGFTRYAREGVPHLLGRRLETEARRVNGTMLPIELTVTEVKAEGRTFFTAYLRDISDRRNAQRALERLAFFDTLTGLPNRTAVIRDLTTGQTMAEAVIAIQLLDVAMLSASLGQDFADRLLTAVAGRLKLMVSEEDTLARTGDAQFAIVLRGAVSAPDLGRHLGQDLASILRQPLILEGRTIRISAAVGIALPDEDGSGNLLQDAEMACHSCGADSIRVFDSSLRHHYRERFDIEADLREALAQDGEIRAFFQPIYNLQDGRLSGFEALARWRHHRRGELSPAVFIPVAEATGLVLPLGERMLDQAIAASNRWAGLTADPARRAPVLFASANISVRQFADPELAAKIERRVGDLDPSRQAIKLELTESMLMVQSDETMGILHRLRAAGLKLAIDDFGTGYSSLSYLRRFPINSLKIDRSFITAMTRSPQDREVVRVIIELAHILDLEVIAEGIETEKERDLLIALGCDYGQGYLLGRPMPAEQADQLVASLSLPANALPGGQGAITDIGV